MLIVSSSAMQVPWLACASLVRESVSITKKRASADALNDLPGRVILIDVSHRGNILSKMCLVY